jgi:hypothetical protein
MRRRENALFPAVFEFMPENVQSVVDIWPAPMLRARRRDYGAAPAGGGFQGLLSAAWRSLRVGRTYSFG